MTIQTVSRKQIIDQLLEQLYQKGSLDRSSKKLLQELSNSAE